jgi:aspartate/methionine/tyrosine aminotransferase
MQFETYPFEKLNRLLSDVVPCDAYAPLSLTIGEPQFETPAFIQDELKAHSAELNKYPKTAGEAYLKRAMLHYLHVRFDLQLSPEQLIPTFGTREVLFNFPQFLLHDAENPLMCFPNPFYQIYEGAAKASRADVVYLHLSEENGFIPEADESVLAEANLVILNTPSNPTASVMDFETMRRWVRLALEHDFVLLNDECYVDLYLNEPIPSLLNAAVAEGNDDFKNILVVNSASKRSSAPGLRSGFIAGDAAILRDYMTYRTYVGCASPLPLQRAAAVAWEDQDHTEIFREKYRRNFALAKEILGVDAPEATFYIWLKVDDEIDFTLRAYRDYNLKVLPGSFLGREGAGKGYVRLALVYEEDTMREALMRVKKVREALSQEG